MGLPLPGPPDFKEMPTTFTVSFWVLVKELNTKSFFVNLFNRAYVWSESTNNNIWYKFITGPNPDTDFVAPTPTPNAIVSSEDKKIQTLIP
jgi:hypothetical protein